MNKINDPYQPKKVIRPASKPQRNPIPTLKDLEEEKNNPEVPKSQLKSVPSYM